MIFRSREKRPRKLWKILLVSVLVLVIAAFATGLLVYRQYTEALKPVSSDQTEVTVTIEPGYGTKDIAGLLQDKGLIRKASAFEWYVRLERASDLRAGTYRLRPNMGVAEIVGVLQAGKEATDLVTILPAKRLSEIKGALLENGFDEAEVDAALEPSQYAGHPALAEKPAQATLEGYLYPESFQRISSTTVVQVISASLDEMSKVLTAEVRTGIKAQGLTVHEGIILASVVENEVSHLEERPQVGQVFLKRLKIDMRLESNATDDYPDNFNTYQIAGLPPAPLTNVTKSSLEAVAFPAKTDHLFFVTGADCVTRFSSTITAHQQ